MLKHRRVFVPTVALVLGIAALVGCSRLPTEPSATSTPPTEFVNPSFVMVPTSQGLRVRRDGALAVVPAVVTNTIDGAVGGQVVAGRFTLTIPAGAFAGAADVTINVPDPAVMHCFLEITPASANGFLVPVTLAGDCQGAAILSPSNLAVVSNDVVLGVWRIVPQSATLGGTYTVEAPLAHFSEYGIVETKAGW